MYVIPQDSIPKALPTSYLDWTSVSRQELEILLHHVTPLPSSAGSVLGWNNSLVHWGGRTVQCDAYPRISIASHFLPDGTKPKSHEAPGFDENLPTFSARLRLIGQALRSYEKFEPLMRRYRGLATKLVEWDS
jgi:hypothetical protein